MRVARGLARWAGIVLENAELYRRSQEVQELLRQANEDKDEFLAMVSHELRTPITTIYGGSRLLHLRRPILNEAAIADMIASVAEEAEQLYFLVEDLLALARTETSARVEREPVSVAQVLPQVVHRYARGHSRSMEPDVPDTLPPVLADPTYLTQVVSNLLSNADKYTPSDLPVEIKAWQDGREVLVRVKDHGPGVPEAELDQIFERFFRSSQTASTASGKGLGLTVCKRLVEAMDGRIWAQNAPEGGLEVMFTLAVAEEEEAEPAVEEALGAAE
jgi:K+-sensing histidine kinase KdpD